MTLYQELNERGLVYQSTDSKVLDALLEREKVCMYLGFDPTASSLHVGSLVQLYMLAHFARRGHRAIALFGTGTAHVGDPSGKNTPRPMLESDVLMDNAKKIQIQADVLFERLGVHVEYVDNFSWFKNLKYLDVLRDIGPHFSVSRMLSFDTYKRRLNTGLTFLEFNYQLLQSYDYLHLHKTYGCTLQVGGADQWANIIAGVDIIRRKTEQTVHALTVPLVTLSNGVKMGKTEQGAIYLDAQRTSPFDFYQYWRNLTDVDARRFIYIFSFWDFEKIENMLIDINSAKMQLARSVTALVHGKEIAESVSKAAKSVTHSSTIHQALPTIKVEKKLFEKDDSVISFIRATNVLKSTSEIRRLIDQRGVKIDGVLASSYDQRVNINATTILLQLGKKRAYTIRLM